MTKKVFILISLFLISSAFHIKIININFNPYDEAVILIGAERILHGEIPYRDFFSQYTPGQYYILALIFKIFGISVLVERIYDIALKSLLSISIFLIINLLSSYRYALIGWAFSLIWGGHINFPAYPVYPAILFINMCIYSILLYLRQKRIFYIHLSAIFIVFSGLFRHDMGGMAFIMITLILFIIRYTDERPSYTFLIHFVITTLIVTLPFIIYFALKSDIKAIVDHLIIFPLSNFQKFQSIHYPRYLSFHTLPFFAFPIILFTGFIIAIVLMRKKEFNITTQGILLISLVGGTFMIQAIGRSDIVHLLPVGLMSVMLAPILLFVIRPKLGIHRETPLIILFIAFFCIILYRPLKMRIASFPYQYIIKEVNPDIPRARYTKLRDNEIKKVISFIKQNTTRNEFIYSGLKDHDDLRFNNALIYFLSERKIATRYHEMNPGFTTMPEVQKEIMNELKYKDVKLIVLIPGLWNAPDIDRYKKDYNVLDNYIANNFKLTKMFGKYEIWMKNTK
jgi:hypothetical protein